MITNRQRKLLKWLLRLKLVTPYENMRLIDFRARRGLRWVTRWIRRTQKVDNLHHAPCCQANHYHRCRIVFQRCTCGANREMREGASDWHEGHH